MCDHENDAMTDYIVFRRLTKLRENYPDQSLFLACCTMIGDIIAGSENRAAMRASAMRVIDDYVALCDEIMKGKEEIAPNAS